ncbi:MAG: hypothetical protein EZS28_056065, partial [Streblomastix strix]
MPSRQIIEQNRTLGGYWSRQMGTDRSRTCVDRLIEADETAEYAWRVSCKLGGSVHNLPQ